MTKLSHDNSSVNKNKRTSLLSEIQEALEHVSYGSIEIFVQNKVVTQITVRNIKKTSVDIEESDDVDSHGVTFQHEENHSRKTIVRRS